MTCRVFNPSFHYLPWKSSDELVKGEVLGTLYGMSNRGWMNEELFDFWFKHHFLVHAPSVRPLLFLLDGHSSYYIPGFIEIAVFHQVIVFLSPSQHYPPYAASR